MSEPAITVDGPLQEVPPLPRPQPEPEGRRDARPPGPLRGVLGPRDVSLEIAEGATYGFIGANGSGKSTLLKCLARILEPDEGTVRTRGKVSALLELGAGFHPELSGRENVYLNGSILGLSKAELDRRFDDIVEFAGLERFIDTPVKNYSSGMYVRLGFSVAINVDPDILLVDEVLAVGDEEFQRRCNERFAELRAEGKTIVVVSHALGSVQAICDEVAWLDRGVLRAIGAAGDVVDEYLAEVHEDRSAEEHATRAGGARARSGSTGSSCSTPTAGPPATCAPATRSPSASTTTPPSRSSAPSSRWRSTPSTACSSPSPNTPRGRAVPDRIEGAGIVDLVVDPLLLLPGTYDMSAPSPTTPSLHVYDSPPPGAALRRRARRPARELRGRRHPERPVEHELDPSSPIPAAAAGRAPAACRGHRADRPRRPRPPSPPSAGSRSTTWTSRSSGRARTSTPQPRRPAPHDYLVFVPAATSCPRTSSSAASTSCAPTSAGLVGGPPRRRPPAPSSCSCRSAPSWSATAPSTPWAASTRGSTDLEDVDLGWRMWLAGYRVRSVGAGAAGRRHRRPRPAEALRAAHPLVLASVLDDTSLDAGLVRRRPARPRAGRPPAAPALQRSRSRGDGELLPLAHAAVAPLGRRTTPPPRRWPRCSQRWGAPERAGPPPPHRGGHLRHAGARGWPAPASAPSQIARRLAEEHDVVLATTGRCELAGRRASRCGGRRAGPARPRAVVRRLRVPGVGARRARLPRGPPTRWSSRTSTTRCTSSSSSRATTPRGSGAASTPCATPRRAQRAARPGRLLALRQQKQRDLWLGQLAALGRINPVTYDGDESLRSLLAVVPFGVGDEPPGGDPLARSAAPSRASAPTTRSILWGGGVYNWFDPLTLVRAVDRLGQRMPEVRLLFLGMRHPNPEVPRDADGRRDPARWPRSSAWSDRTCSSTTTGSPSTTARTSCSTPTSA